MSHITSHILDTSRGRPAPGIPVILYHLKNEDWLEIDVSVTDSDGRMSNLPDNDTLLEPGFYKIKFLTKEYFDRFSVVTFYPFIEVNFILTGDEHYHIALLLNPFGYTTYRGS